MMIDDAEDENEALHADKDEDNAELPGRDDDSDDGAALVRELAEVNLLDVELIRERLLVCWEAEREDTGVDRALELLASERELCVADRDEEATVDRELLALLVDRELLPENCDRELVWAERDEVVEATDDVDDRSRELVHTERALELSREEVTLRDDGRELCRDDERSDSADERELAGDCLLLDISELDTAEELLDDRLEYCELDVSDDRELEWIEL